MVRVWWSRARLEKNTIAILFLISRSKGQKCGSSPGTAPLCTTNNCGSGMRTECLVTVLARAAHA